MILRNSKTMRELDNAAIVRAGIPSIQLMKNAAEHLATVAADMAGENRRAVIFCGSGNNGGDGIAAAILLVRAGFAVRVYLVGSREKMTPDTREMERLFVELGGTVYDFTSGTAGLERELASAGVTIDAMFGIGLRSELRGLPLEAARLMNATPSPILAADIPSGVEADTGRVLGYAVNAAVTVTFTSAKPGHFAEPGCLWCGEVLVRDIGIPSGLMPDADTFSIGPAEAALPRRPRISHKGTFGRLLVVGGSTGLTGAPSFASRAAIRSGAGLVYIGVPRDIYDITAVKNDEAMPFPLASDADGRISREAYPVIRKRLEEMNAAVIGPGLGRSADLKLIVRELVREAAVPLILDADALDAVADEISVLREAKHPVVLTPHEGEFARLGGDISNGDRIGAAREFAAQNHCVLVLKGHRTICAFPDGEVYITTTGNPGMATGGTGDVLAGMIGALLCQLPLKRAVITAVWLHGAAGDVCAAKLGEYSMTPGDIIDMLPEILKKQTER